MATKPVSPYRQLQLRCKAAGLPANKSAVVLAQLLAEHEETTEEDAPITRQPTATNGRASKSTPNVSGADEDEGCLMGLWPNELGGISNKGLFNAIPSWVNPKLPPGHTSQIEQLGLDKTLETIAYLKHIVWSPNLVWLTMAVSMHIFAPYDLEAAKKGFSADWILARFCLNYVVAFGYYSFFFLGLYVFNMSGRKYLEGSYPTFGNMAHNLYYWSLGVLQWTWWEAVMCRLWALELVKFSTWENILDDKYLLLLNIFWVVMIPVWRDIHFYIAHRFLHVRSIYTYVHKLHHRNADPEPFSGMTMHPIEHLYYFSNCFTPSLYMSGLSPLIFTWNLIHLSIAPGAGHSGWEDHFQSDQYHYIHHAKFEANYGSPMSGCVDQMLGTFRETLGESKVYRGEWTEKNDDNAAALAAIRKKAGSKVKVWAPNSYLGFPASWDHAVYTAFWVALFPIVWVASTRPSDIPTILPVFELFEKRIPQIVAITVAYVPVALGMVLSVLAGDKMSWRWPFQKESLAGVFGLFVVLAWASCILPVYHATLWTVEAAM